MVAARWPSQYTLTIANSTIARNVVPGESDGGGLAVHDRAKVNVNNSIIWGNEGEYGNQILSWATADGYVDIQYSSDVQRLDYYDVGGFRITFGDGNLGTDPAHDPLFMDTLARDYSLADGSACIDVASNELVSPDLVDLDGDDDVVEPTPFDLAGNPRVANGDGDEEQPEMLATVEMGAYEGLGIALAPQEAPAPHNYKKNRYISFDPANGGRGRDPTGGQSVAFQVELIDSLYFPDSTGVLGWVGPPDDNGVSGVYSYRVDRVWSEPLIQVSYRHIVPVATYEIRAIAEGADELDPANFTDPLLIATIDKPGMYYWADCVGPLGYHCFDGGAECTDDSDCEGTGECVRPFGASTYAPCQADEDCPSEEYCRKCTLRWAPPDGFVNFQDVSAAVYTFSASPQVTVADIPSVDLHGYTTGSIHHPPNYVVNFTDIQLIVLAFRGAEYPFDDPADCPGQPGGGGSPLGGGMMMAMTFGGPSPVFALEASADLIEPGQVVDVEVYIDSAEDLGAYEVSLEVSGGKGGYLELEELFIDTAREDYVFGPASIAQGVSPGGRRLGAVLWDGGVAVEEPAYLGTFRYRASPEAQGWYTVSVRANPHSFLNDCEGVDLSASPGVPAVIGCDLECLPE